MFSMRKQCMTVLVAGLALAAAPAAASASRPATAPSGGPTQASHVPAPPDRVGCYEFSDGQWQHRQCASRSYIAQHIPHPEVLAGVGETSGASGVGAFDLGIVSATPMVGGSDTDTKFGAGYYSLQDNVFFTGNNGDQDGVQFTDQSGGGIANSCVWQVDINTQTYTPACLPFPSSITGRITLVEGFALGGTLGIFVQGSKSGVLLSVIIPDLYDLGKSGRWNNNSGSVLGYGNGSEAVFTTTEERIGVSAASCLNATGPVAWTVPCTASPVKPHGYVGYTPGPLSYGAFTDESNNLVPVIGSPPAHLPAVSYPNSHAVSTTYVASTTGKCFTGTPPTCG
jgi:hypothetical protein